MIYSNLPKVNEKMFLINKEVVVLKVIEVFRLAQIQYLGSLEKYVVDIGALSSIPDKSNSISIKILGGVMK
jgi:hypothetical protein